MKKNGILLLLILSVGAGLRIARINFDSLMFDEQWHMELSTGRGSPHVSLPEDVYIADAPATTSLVDAPSWYAVWTHMDEVVHPPLYVTLLRIWREVFGQGDIAARALSILCSLLAITFMFFAARELHGAAPALWAAAIFAVAPTQVLFAQQVRGYDMLGTLAMGAVWALVRIEKHDPSIKACAALGLCIFGMLLTHYFAIGAVAAMGVYILIRFKGRSRRDALAAMILTGAVFLIVWGPFGWKQRTNVSGNEISWLMEHSPEHLSKTLVRLANWPWQLVLNGAQSEWAMIAAAVFVVPLFFLRRRPDLLLWCLWLAGTLGFVTLLDILHNTSHLRFVRYIWLASPAVFLVVMVTLRLLPTPLFHSLAGLIVILALQNWRMAYVSEEPDWRVLGQVLDQKSKPSEPLLFISGLQPEWYSRIYYLGASHYSHSFPRGIVKLSKPASKELMMQLTGPTAWLITGQMHVNPPGPTAADVEMLLPGAIILEQQVIPNLVICTRVRLAEQ